jgi:hypothetical protein
MQTIRLLLVVISICIFTWSKAYSNGADDAYVTLVETYGISTEKEEGKYRTIIFIPRTFLLFDIDKEEPDLKVGKKYLAATTQDGVRVYILEKAVSNGPFKTVFGNQDVIFNKSHRVCFESSCNQDDDDQLLQINAGEVFKTEEKFLDGNVVYKLIGNRGNRNTVNEITGYISKEELDKLNHKSIVTYATLRHPRYAVTSKEASVINTKCGEKRKRDETKGVITISETDQELIAAFNLADIGGNNDLLKFTRDYGRAGQEIVYKLYNVVDRRVEPNIETTYAAQIIYNCDEQDIFRKRRFIESVSILNRRTGEPQTFKPDGTPNNLIEYTGATYLYSVNNSKQYFSLMDKLSDKFESRALAGYFLAEFNRSCRGTDRRNETCQHSAYDIDFNN